MNTKHLFNLNVKITPPDTIQKIVGLAYKIKDTAINDQNQHRISREFNELIKKFIKERYPKDERFPGKEQNIMINARASKGVAVIRVAAQNDPYNLDYYSACQYTIKEDDKGNPTVTEKRAIFCDYGNINRFLENGPSEDSKLQIEEDFEPLITHFQD